MQSAWQCPWDEARSATGTSTQKSSNVGVWYPAREPGVIAVGGTERDGEGLWSGSIRGKETVVTAPATDLVGARPDGYWRIQGTSFAAPMVSATAALISIVSLSPGTLCAELSDDRRSLLVHVLDLDDEAALTERIKSRYETPLKEIFLCLPS